MKTRTKGKELMMVVAVCALSIGLFGTAFAGFNHLTFAAATGGATPLPPITATATPTQNLSQFESNAEPFVALALTLIESDDQHMFQIPASALTMEEAAQTGARYIWDVFETSIDGMYVDMMFRALASQTNTTWTGVVYAEDPVNHAQTYDAITYAGDRIGFPLYTFTINGITGERIDINCLPRRSSTPVYADVDIRTPLLDSGWFDMNINEQVALTKISDEALEAYTQTATRLAGAQFNNSVVSNIQLVRLVVSGMTGNVVNIATLNFTAVDNIGREVFITIPSTDSVWEIVSISTSHNDFIPGFMHGPEAVIVDRDTPETINSYAAAGNSSAMVHLQENNGFVLQGSAFISHMPTGKYRIENGKLFLAMDGDDIIFSMEKDRLIFESGEWLENWVEKGTVFHFAVG
jgi:hypothetical protein